MNYRNTRFVVLLVLFLGICVGAWLFLGTPGEQSTQTLALAAPLFVQTARAEGDATLAGIVNEAGIAGYYNAGGPITINNDVRSAFRTIEAETPTYIVGSVAVPNFPETYDVHVYVQTDGWIMAYYLKNDVAGKIVDWKHYQSSNKTAIQTVFENVAAIVAGAAGKPYTGLTYYDFRFPEANRMMLIAEAVADENTFTVQLPSSFVYYERSWSILGHDVDIDDVRVWDGFNQFASGSIQASQLLPDVPHTIKITSNSSDVGGLALVYKEP